MILSDKISIHRIVSGTGKHLLFNVLTSGLTYFIYAYFLSGKFEISVLLPSILGTALAFFIGFNNNQSYDRWWEARKIWGALVNDSRTWARQLVYFYTETTEEERKDYTKKMVERHISFLYALKQNLRKSKEDEYKKYISEEEIALIDKESNKANALLSLQLRDLDQLYATNKMDGFRFAEMNKILINFCDEMGKSERISNTVFPTTYNFYTRIFIWAFIISVTIVTAQSMGAWSIMVGTFIGYVFLTIHKIGQSLLNPFLDMPTGIPLNHITRTIEINMLEAIGETEIPAPIQSEKGEYIM